MESENNDLKLKISQSLNNLNQRSEAFDELINDYNILYKKYMDIQKRPEANQRLLSFQINKPEETPKVDQSELEKKYNLMEKEYFKKKEENEKNIVEINNKLQQIMDLKNKMDIKDKKINGYSAENSALKQQNMVLDKKNKELNDINNRNEKLIFELNKFSQKMEIDHKKLLDSAGKMHMEIDKLRTKLLELQETIINKDNQINELKANSKQKIEEFKEEFRRKSLIKPIIIEENEINIPDKLKYKAKNHFGDITSIYFNNSGNSYLTSGKDKLIHLYDAEKNLETYEIPDFSDVVTEACFDNKDSFLFAGSYDKTAKLYSLKTFKLLCSFNEHNNRINCVKSSNTNSYGFTGSSDKTIKEWDYNSEKMITTFDCGNECYSLSIAPDDSFFLSGQLDGTVKLFGIKNNNEKVFNLHQEKVADVKLIKNDLFLSLSKDMQIKLFDLRKEEAVYTIDKNKNQECCKCRIAISPDKKHFAVGSDIGMIYIININDGNIISEINNNKGSGSVTGLCWSPNNKQIYAGDSNGFISIWGSDFE